MKIAGVQKGLGYELSLAVAGKIPDRRYAEVWKSAQEEFKQNIPLPYQPFPWARDIALYAAGTTTLFAFLLPTIYTTLIAAASVALFALGVFTIYPKVVSWNDEESAITSLIEGKAVLGNTTLSTLADKKCAKAILLLPKLTSVPKEEVNRALGWARDETTMKALFSLGGTLEPHHLFTWIERERYDLIPRHPDRQVRNEKGNSPIEYALTCRHWKGAIRALLPNPADYLFPNSETLLIHYLGKRQLTIGRAAAALLLSRAEELRSDVDRETIAKIDEVSLTSIAACGLHKSLKHLLNTKKEVSREATEALPWARDVQTAELLDRLGAKVHKTSTKNDYENGIRLGDPSLIRFFRMRGVPLTGSEESALFPLELATTLESSKEVFEELLPNLRSLKNLPNAKHLHDAVNAMGVRLRTNYQTNFFNLLKK